MLMSAPLVNTTWDSASVVADFASRTVAHIDARGANPPTFVELDDAISAIGDVYKSVALLVDCASPFDVVPYIQGDWKLPFRVALFYD